MPYLGCGHMMDSLDIQDHLEAWGLWVLADGNGLGYSSPMATLMRKYVVEPCSNAGLFCGRLLAR